MTSTTESTTWPTPSSRQKHLVYQIDGWPNRDHDDIIVSPDDEGDALTSAPDTEYFSRSMGDGGVAVRVHILNGTDQATTVRLLRKIADWVEKGAIYDADNNIL